MLRPSRHRHSLWMSAFLVMGCIPSATAPSIDDVGDPRLQARPHTPTVSTPSGESVLGLGTATRDGLLYVPERLVEAGPMPLVVSLHGATGDADNWRSWYALADSMGFALLAIDSRDITWDRTRGGFGQDVEFIDRALEHVFDRLQVDPSRVTLAGFSDGASYALSLGVANGDLFTHLLAYSPGYFLPADANSGDPLVWISHGTSDTILPFTNTEGRLLPRLRADGYTVTFVPFAGGHTIPGAIARDGLEWAVGSRVAG